jgi:hypothetical protein
LTQITAVTPSADHRDLSGTGDNRIKTLDSLTSPIELSLQLGLLGIPSLGSFDRTRTIRGEMGAKGILSHGLPSLSHMKGVERLEIIIPHLSGLAGLIWAKKGHFTFLFLPPGEDWSN